jgi:hypothetical protein
VIEEFLTDSEKLPACVCMWRSESFGGILHSPLCK